MVILQIREDTQSFYSGILLFIRVYMCMCVHAWGGGSRVECNSDLFLHSCVKTMHKKTSGCRAVEAHIFNPSTWEAEAGEFLSLRPAWSTE